VILVLCKRRTVGRGNRHELVGEHARLERAWARCWFDRESVLLGAGNLVALRDDLGVSPSEIVHSFFNRDW